MFSGQPVAHRELHEKRAKPLFGVLGGQQHHLLLGCGYLVGDNGKNFRLESVVFAYGMFELFARDTPQGRARHCFHTIKIAASCRYAKNVASIKKPGDDATAICYNFKETQYTFCNLENMICFVTFKKHRTPGH
ncbi:hypothetical protein D3C87_1734010 [compost metagenome]